jgi:hypothetical protein
MTVSKETAQAVASEIDKAVRDILAKHGLESGKTSMGYGEWFDFKITATAVELGLNGVNLASKEATYYTKFGYTAYLGGDIVSDTGTPLTAVLGTRFQGDYFFAGIDAKKRKNPIVAIDRKTGKTVFFAENIIPRLNLASEQAGA